MEGLILDPSEQCSTIALRRTSSDGERRYQKRRACSGGRLPPSVEFDGRACPDLFFIQLQVDLLSAAATRDLCGAVVFLECRELHRALRPLFFGNAVQVKPRWASD